eukprot:TRINITY_DN48757_c0_g1_i1.p1 TRINITY_DN48757_c0_g1~~TRINITY_DN48757_c0_g1_i1.p1  ORF type:complete len:127 (-),score=30.75 TRINITY_DN48757_c0_g1_i1:119-499(-)
MIRRPPRSTLSSSSAASDVYKRQVEPPVRLFDAIVRHCVVHSVLARVQEHLVVLEGECGVLVVHLAVPAVQLDVDLVRVGVDVQVSMCEAGGGSGAHHDLSLIHISEPTRLLSISYAVFCLKKKKR